VFSLWEGWPSEKELLETGSEKNKSEATDTMGSLSVDDTKGSAFSAVRVSSMRLVDKWVWESGESHHMTAITRYFAMYKRF